MAQEYSNNPSSFERTKYSANEDISDGHYSLAISTGEPEHNPTVRNMKYTEFAANIGRYTQRANERAVLTQFPNRPGPPSVCYTTQGGRQYRSDLNNIAKKYRLKLSYEQTCEGPQNDCHWTATAYIDEVPYGTGKSRDKGGARELASKEAVEALESAGYAL